VLETVTLTQQDTLPGILTRLRIVQADRLLFVVPPKLSLDPVDLRVLRREAAACGKGVALLTSNAGLRKRAAEAGISTFRVRAWAERAHWHKPQTADRRPRPVGPAEALAPDGPGLFAPKSPSGFRPATFLRAFVRRPSPWWTELGLIVVLAALFGGLLYALATVIPEAVITVTPAAEPLQVTVPLRAIQDAVADAEAGIVPARALSAQVQGEGKLPTTGRRYEPSAKATGNVVLINRTTRDLIVPIGTIVATATGNNVRFATTKEASLAANGRATVPVEAALAGPSGNVRAGTITRVEGALSLSLLVANDANFSGGGVAQVGVVTDDDKEKLQALVFEQLKDKALERLNERVEAGSFIPPDSVVYSALSPTFTPFVGEVSPELYLSMSVQAVGLTVDATAGNELALARLRQEMPPGSRLISETIKYIPGAVAVEDARTVSFTIIAEGILLRGVDTAAVRSAVLGLKPAPAAALLADRFALAQPPTIHLGPDWLPYVIPTDLPILPWRIRVVTDWDGGAAAARK
jgi:hypothetical protein